MKLEEEVKRLTAIEKALLASPDKQISLTDPDCRSMATSGRGSGMVAYNVQSGVDTKNHLIVAHEVTNVGTDRSQLATMAQATKAALRSDNLDVVADRGYFKGQELLACEQAGVAVTLPKPQTVRALPGVAFHRHLETGTACSGASVDGASRVSGGGYSRRCPMIRTSNI